MKGPKNYGYPGFSPSRVLAMLRDQWDEEMALDLLPPIEPYDDPPNGDPLSDPPPYAALAMMPPSAPTRTDARGSTASASSTPYGRRKRVAKNRGGRITPC